MVSVKSPLAIRLVNGYWQKKKKVYLSLEYLHLFTFTPGIVYLPAKLLGLAVLFILEIRLCLAMQFNFDLHLMVGRVCVFLHGMHYSLGVDLR
jgi:hypothetical protein